MGQAMISRRGGGGAVKIGTVSAGVCFDGTTNSYLNLSGVSVKPGDLLIGYYGQTPAWGVCAPDGITWITAKNAGSYGCSVVFDVYRPIK